jgi:hypothetical protein
VAWAPDYITDAQLKAYLRIGDSDDDAQIAFAITAASRAVDGACGHRQFGKVDIATEWLYSAKWDSSRHRWVVPIDDLSSATGLVVKIDGVATTAYTLWPRRALSQGRVYTELVFDAGVAATAELDLIAITSPNWGWPAVPGVVEQGTLIQSSRFLARRESPYGIAGSPEAGSEIRLLSRLDPDVRMMLVAAQLVRLAAA